MQNYGESMFISWQYLADMEMRLKIKYLAFQADMDMRKLS